MDDITSIVNKIFSQTEQLQPAGNNTYNMCFLVQKDYAHLIRRKLCTAWEYLFRLSSNALYNNVRQFKYEIYEINFKEPAIKL